MSDDIVVGKQVYTPVGKSEKEPGRIYYDKDPDGVHTVDMRGIHYRHTRDLKQSVHPVDWSQVPPLSQVSRRTHILPSDLTPFLVLAGVIIVVIVTYLYGGR